MSDHCIVVMLLSKESLSFGATPWDIYRWNDMLPDIHLKNNEAEMREFGANKLSHGLMISDATMCATERFILLFSLIFVYT